MTVILLATGSFCPPHRGHVSTMYTARDHLVSSGVVRDPSEVRGVFSPTHDDYVRSKLRKSKGGWICATQRIELLQLAIADDARERGAATPPGVLPPAASRDSEQQRALDAGNSNNNNSNNNNNNNNNGSGERMLFLPPDQAGSWWLSVSQRESNLPRFVDFPEIVASFQQALPSADVYFVCGEDLVRRFGLGSVASSCAGVIGIARSEDGKEAKNKQQQQQQMPQSKRQHHRLAAGVTLVPNDKFSNHSSTRVREAWLTGDGDGGGTFPSVAVRLREIGFLE
jgi:nicotinic acid mononucleotide adenylyltransferase